MALRNEQVAYRLGTAQDITLTAGGNSSQTTGITAGITLVRLYSTADVRVLQNPTGVTTAPTISTGTYIPAGSYEYFAVQAGDKFYTYAVGTGLLNITEMAAG
jgi:hypothetical protein